jgi:hypothetical protein
MGYIATFQTRMARAVLRQAEADEHDHLRDCVTCGRAKGRRAGCCPYGQCLYDIRVQAAAKLREERKLDQAVPPGQMALF